MTDTRKIVNGGGGPLESKRSADRPRGPRRPSKSNPTLEAGSFWFNLEVLCYGSLPLRLLFCLLSRG